MSKLWCPYAGSTCEDGYLTLKDDLCVMWDEEEQVCLVRENAKCVITELRIRAELQAKFQQRVQAQKILKG